MLAEMVETASTPLDCRGMRSDCNAASCDREAQWLVDQPIHANTAGYEGWKGNSFRVKASWKGDRNESVGLHVNCPVDAHPQIRSRVFEPNRE